MVEQCKDWSQNKRRQGTGGRVSQTRWERDRGKRQQAWLNSEGVTRVHNGLERSRGNKRPVAVSCKRVEFKPGEKEIASRGNKRWGVCCWLLRLSTTHLVSSLWSRCSSVCCWLATLLLLSCIAVAVQGDSCSLSFCRLLCRLHSRCSRDSHFLLRLSLSFICRLCTMNPC